MPGRGWKLVDFDEKFNHWASITKADDETKQYVRDWIDGLTSNHQPPEILPPMPGQTYLADPEDPDDTGQFEDCFNGFIRGLPDSTAVKIGYEIDLYDDTITCLYLFEPR